ncbi:MAG: glycosyltransferase family 39 protein [Verrucomicrobiales bacterium]|jgi:uncharacterized membrane protein|nr:glycosyltransferase family 39 protein [Verrucomicrobiales bacterium]
MNFQISKNGVWLAMIFLLALVIRIWHSGTQNLWYDELLTLRGASLPWRDMLDFLQTTESSKPPLYYLLVRVFIIFGDTEWWLRLPSILAGAITCIPLYFLGKEIGGERLGLFSSATLAILPLHVYYSQEARMYALWGLTSCLACLFLIRYLKQTKNLDLFWFGLLSALNCYVFTYGVFLFGVADISALCCYRQIGMRNVLKLAAVSVLALIAFLPWLLVIFNNVTHGIGAQTGQQTHGGLLILGYTIYSLIYGFSLGFSPAQLQQHSITILREHPFITLFCILAALSAAVAAFACLREKRHDLFFLKAVAPGLTLLILSPFFASLLSSSVANNCRYSFAAIPFIALVLGSVMEKGSAKFSKLAILPCLLFMLYATANGLNNPAYFRDDIRAATNHTGKILPHPPAAIICAAHLESVCRYYAPEMTFLPLSVSGNQITNDVANMVDAFASEHPKFALIYSRPDHGDPTGALLTFLEKKYRLVEQNKWTGVKVFIFSTK